MPEQYTETVTANQLRKGDLIDGTHKVVDIDVKQKFTYLSIEGEDKQGRFEHVQPFTVTRTRPTKAERTAEMYASILADLERCERRDRRELINAQADVISQAEAGNLHGYAAERLMVASTKVAAWDGVVKASLARTLKALEETGSLDNTGAIVLAVERAPLRVEVVQLIAANLRRRLLEGLQPMSRSTSVASNFEEDAKRQGQLAWLEDLRWSVDLLDRAEES